MDFVGRLEAFRERMGAADIDFTLVGRGANLFYITGIPRQLEHQTDHHAYAEWASGAIIGRDGGLIAFGPRMGGDFILQQAEDKPWINEVRLIYEHEDAEDVLRTVIESVASNSRRVAIDDRAWSEVLIHLQRIQPSFEFSLASDLITPMRTIKSDNEIAALRRAAEMTDSVFGQIIPSLQRGVTEFEIAEEIERLFQTAGADYLSFQTGIVFAGPNRGRQDGITRAKGSRKLTEGDSITFDFGCVLNGYCSDFGRSAFVGEPPAEYLKIHDIVLEAQSAAIERMRAGEITAAATNAVAREVIADAGYDAGFTHRLGHGIGVTVHEKPFLDVMDHTLLQENMVYTVEPSIRLKDSYCNRVEDVVAVTKAGGMSLNRASHDLVIIE